MVSEQLNSDNPVIRLTHLGHQIERFVLRSIVDYDDLEVVAGTAFAGVKHSPQKFLDKLCFIVTR